jgi:hypothetical protein
MKKFVIGFYFMFLSVVLFAQAPVKIDDAILKSANEVIKWVEQKEGTKNGIIINEFIKTSPSLSDYIKPRLRAELQKRLSYLNRDLTTSEKLLLRDSDTGRISNDSIVPGSDLIALRFRINVTCEDKGDYYEYFVDVVDMQVEDAYVSLPITVKKDLHISRIVKRDTPSDLRLLTGAFNIVLGAGSLFLDGDFGGLWITAGELAAGGLILIELYGLKYHNTLAGWVGPIGVGFGVAAIIGGFARPYIYSRNYRIAEIADNFHIAVIPNDESLAVSLSYKIEF